MAEQPTSSQSGPQQTAVQSSVRSTDDPVMIETKEGADVVQEDIEKAMFENNGDEVFHMTVDLQELLRGNRSSFMQEAPEIYKRLEKLLAQAQWFVLERCDPEEVEQLFKEHFEHFFEYSLEEMLDKEEMVLRASVPLWEDRDLWKRKFREAINKSQVKLGKDKIKFGDSEVVPTVQNWLRDWRDFVGDKEITPLLAVEYMNASDNARKLTGDDKQHLENILRFYTHLYKSSTTREGSEQRMMLEDPERGTYTFFEHGEIEDTGIEIPAKELEEMRANIGLNKDGKPMTMEQLVKTPEFRQNLAKYAKPNQQEIPMEDKDTTPPPPPKLKKKQEEKEENDHLGLPPIPDELLHPKPKKKVKPPKQKKQKKPKAIKTKKATPVPAPKDTPAPAASLKTAASAPPPPAAPSESQYHIAAQRVLQELALLLESVDMEKRFISVITSYLKGVREKNDVRDALRTPQEGGINLPLEQADQVIQAAEEIWQEEQAHPHTVRGEAAEEQEEEFRPTLDLAQKRIAQAEKRKKKMQELKGEPTEEPVQELEDILANVNPIFDKQIQQAAADHKKEKQETQETSAQLPSTGASKKQVITDIIQPSGGGAQGPKVMGPVEELQNMNTTEFRRLSSDPKQAAQAIIDKVQLLEQDSVSKKAEGIAAWQESPLNQMYIEVGNKSLEKSVPVTEIIKQMTQSDQAALTQEEFDAISDLNQQLRF